MATATAPRAPRAPKQKARGVSLPGSGSLTGGLFAGELEGRAPPRATDRDASPADPWAGGAGRGHAARRPAPHPNPPVRRSLPAQRAAGRRWLGKLLELAARHADRGEEVFRAPVARVEARGDKHAVSRDALSVGRHRPSPPVERAVGVPRRAPLPPTGGASGGSGGAHAYWKLAQPLQASRMSTRRPAKVVGADRARQPAARPRTGSGRRRQAERRRPRVRGALARDAPRRHGQRQDRPVRPHHRGRLPPCRRTPSKGLSETS